MVYPAKVGVDSIYSGSKSEARQVQKSIYILAMFK